MIHKQFFYFSSSDYYKIYKLSIHSNLEVLTHLFLNNIPLYYMAMVESFFHKILKVYVHQLHLILVLMLEDLVLLSYIMHYMQFYLSSDHRSLYQYIFYILHNQQFLFEYFQPHLLLEYESYEFLHHNH